MEAQLNVGVLALQGSFAEHGDMLQRLGAKVTEVRLPAHLNGLDGLIIPGGESTTIGKLAVHYGLIEPLREFGSRRAIWGTCAGAIFLSRDARRNQPLLNMMDITVERNAFGSQVQSFETDLLVPALVEEGEEPRPFHAIFIRAPVIESVRGAVRAIVHLADGRIAAAQEGRWLATVFHPELTGDIRFHRYFLWMVQKALAEDAGAADPVFPLRRRQEVDVQAAD